MAYINLETLLANKSKTTKIRDGISLKQYCLTDTGDEEENERRKRLLDEYSNKNKISVSKVSYGSGKRVWWKCQECGYEWQAPPSWRTGKDKCGCGKCAGKIVSEKNSLLSFIEKNGAYGEKLRREYSSKNELGLDEICYGSRKKVWWKCTVCKKEWEGSLNSRTGVCKSGCPYCASKVVSERNSLLSFIEKNGKFGEQLRKEYSPKNEKTLSEITYASNKKVIWECSICKKEWLTSPSNRTGIIKRGCPYCNRSGTSFPEQLIFYILKRELDTHEVFNRDKSEGHEIDIYIPSLKFGVEYDGWKWHKEKQEEDNKKHQFFKERGLDIIRIIGKENDKSLGVNCNLEYNITKDTELTEAREYIKEYLLKHYNIEIDVSLTEDEIEECKKEARKQIENTLGGFDIEDLDIIEDEEIWLDEIAL